MIRRVQSRATAAPPTRDYAAFVARYFSHYATVACAPVQLEAAARLIANPRYHGLWKWFRGAAKSTHASLMLPLWLACHGELRFGLIVGKTKRDAARLLSDVRREVEENESLRKAFAIKKVSANAERLVFTCCMNDGREERITLAALGAGQSPRGLRAGAHRPDYIVADDLDHAAQSRNADRVRRHTDWILEDLLGTFDIGRGRFVQVNNLFSRTSILFQLEQTGRFELSEFNAFDAEGRPTWPAKYGDGAWLRERERMIGYTAFAREYQNTPIDSGSVIRPEWIAYAPARPLADYRALLCYIDPSFTHSNHSDFKAAKLWGALATPTGPEYHQLAAFVRQAPMSELIAWCLDSYERWGRPAHVEFRVEGGMGQQLLIEAFYAAATARGYALPIAADTRAKPNKQARLESIALLWQQGRVRYADALRHDPDTQTGLAQWMAMGLALGHGTGHGASSAHDDGPDADEGALYLLARHTTARALPIVGGRSARAW